MNKKTKKKKLTHQCMEPNKYVSGSPPSMSAYKSGSRPLCSQMFGLIVAQ
ncbi:hypothetical protein Fmac_013219 [Flemingia macrophylla]|uniref:Uncharacterized protein n=1 Tax=Flemingia macrophylla TaxID=520843 RepID=A0ABD1MSI5_9FABA